MERVDYLIIGAGQAGMVLWRFLENTGAVIVDPNPGGYKIGESIIPEHFRHPVMRELLPGIRRRASYTPKHGSTFIENGMVASFPLPEGEAGVAMHLAREDLEQFMLDAWQVPVRRERVLAVDLATKRVRTDSGEYEVRRQIIDCSGPAMVLASAAGTAKRLWPVFATWAYFDIKEDRPERFHGAVAERGWRTLRYDARAHRRLEGDELAGWLPGRSTVLTKIREGTWSWEIPLFDSTVLSYGIVSRHGKVSREDLFETARTQHCPNYTLEPRPLDHSSSFNRLHVRNYFARRADVAATTDYILLSDAFTFADPIYSVGTGLAVNKAIEVATLLNKTEWTSEVCRAYCDRYEKQLTRAVSGFQYWYSGDIMRDDAAATRAQETLAGEAFRSTNEALILHYGNALADADLSGRIGPADPFLIDWARPPLDDAVRPLLDVAPDGTVHQWRFIGANPSAGGIVLRWDHAALPELRVLVDSGSGPAPDGRFGVSYMNLADRPYPMTPVVTALLDRIRGLVDARRDTWRALLSDSGS